MGGQKRNLDIQNEVSGKESWLPLVLPVKEKKFLKNFHTVFPHSFLMKVYITLILKPDTLQKRMNVHTVITDECWYKNTK